MRFGGFIWCIMPKKHIHLKLLSFYCGYLSVQSEPVTSHAVYFSLQVLNIKMDHLNSWEPTHFSQKSYLLTKNFSRKYVCMMMVLHMLLNFSALLFRHHRRQLFLPSIDEKSNIEWWFKSTESLCLLFL